MTLTREDKISLIFAVFPGICSLGVAFISRYYSLSEDRMKEIQAELAARRPEIA